MGVKARRSIRGRGDGTWLGDCDWLFGLVVGAGACEHASLMETTMVISDSSIVAGHAAYFGWMADGRLGLRLTGAGSEQRRNTGASADTCVTSVRT